MQLTQYIIYKMFSYSHIKNSLIYSYSYYILYINFFYSRSLTSQIKNDL